MGHYEYWCYGVADNTVVNKSYVTSGTVLGCYGDYFQWGATGTSSCYKNSEYQQASFIETTLTQEFDIANKLWGGEWRMPTIKEYQDLIEACSFEGMENPIIPSEKINTGGIYWLSSDQIIEEDYTGVAGALFVSIEDPSKRVFFPATGNVCFISYFKQDNRLAGGNDLCEYWSSSLYTNYNSTACVMNCSSSYYSTKNSTTRYIGLTVRPVAR